METINEPLYDLIFLDVYDDDDIDNKYSSRLKDLICINLKKSDSCYKMFKKHVMKMEYIKGLERFYKTHYECLIKDNLDIFTLLKDGKINILNWIMKKAETDKRMKEKFNKCYLKKKLKAALRRKETIIWVFDNKLIWC
jgi:hypothetical protein